ncbi:aldehyde dehydrogenase family protein [Brachybacterium sp. ACRRE]|uniref:aldehyde dehydrogenase family protein n=1 Tax=Brachybacterium sp. ACRRE TaxID=2918184 RepID=UPI001EF29B84|nr:aldehyde dehydrogenase family protein [Brachybacterium sp. ACRRE]MCG7311166.1 aldehyde dehydrogenase family protein [Brachybacterium sp. ACRRE]
MTTSTTTERAADQRVQVRRGPGGPLVAETEMPPLGHFVDGAFDTAGPASAPLVDPSDERQVALLPQADTTVLDRAVDAAAAAFTTWGATTPRERAELLLAIADRIDAEADLLGRLEALDTGKPPSVTADDVSSAADVFRFSAGAARSLTGLGTADYVADHTSLVLREPVGVVGVIVPWNYPLLMAAWKIAPILAVGDTAVVKPAELTPLSLLKRAELTADIVPAGVLNIVLGRGREVGAAMSSHPGVDLIALTGSVGSGRAVASAAAESLKRVHLELGGKAPVLVFEDADLEATAEGLRSASFWNSGQECGAATRVLVHEDVAERFVEHLVEQVRQIPVGTPDAGEDIEVGPLISRTHRERVLAFIDRAQQDGARVAVGGSALPGPGFFVEPTVLVDVQEGTEAAREEVFGPVITVETFADEDEAVRRANDVVYGLAASVWTRDAARSLDVPRRLDFGTVWVNSHLVLASELPWGGFKGSGYGRDLSIHALEDFSRTKHVQINHGR